MFGRENLTGRFIPPHTYRCPLISRNFVMRINAHDLCVEMGKTSANDVPGGGAQARRIFSPTTDPGHRRTQAEMSR